MNEQELRCYTFTDFMLSSIQQGIQSGHASMEIINKYIINSITSQYGYAEQISKWIEKPTIICLNGGNVANIHKIREFLDTQQNPFPFAPFYEEPDQGGNITSVAVILPERIFNTASLLRRRELPAGVCYTHDRLLEVHRFTFEKDGEIRSDEFSDWEYELMLMLNKFNLAQ